MKVLVTGVAGLVGSKVSEQLLAQGIQVVGIDNLNDYYDINLKKYRLQNLVCPNFEFQQIDIENKIDLQSLFKKHNFQVVYNMAARAGVRYSMENPDIYFSTNVIGVLNILECMKNSETKKIVLASTSSLYAGQKMPFKEDLAVNTPISPYSASKKSAEALAYTYHYLYGLDVSILRYFTVYGPAGRPDMSPFIFTDAILKGSEFPIYGDGKHSRDFTYIDDIAEGTIRASKMLGFEIINLGGGEEPYSLLDMISLIEKYSGKVAKPKFSSKMKSDMDVTWANILKAKEILGWKPKISFEEGIERVVAWHQKYINYGGTI